MLRATIGLNYVLGPCVTRNPRAPVGAGGFFMPQVGEAAKGPVRGKCLNLSTDALEALRARGKCKQSPPTKKDPRC